MYNQFCKNVKNFIKLNETPPENFRLRIAKEILFLTDVEAYKSYKETNDVKYKEIKNFIYELQQYSNKYPSLKKFVWELWGYGFDIEKYESVKQDLPETMEEKAKLIDLLLGFHYF